MRSPAWQPKDMITLVIIVGSFILKGLGVNSTTDVILYSAALGHLGLTIHTLRNKR